MCTLPQGGTNSVVHMVNAMNKVLGDCIQDIIMPFLDDILIKGCPVEDKDEIIRPDGCLKFVADHIDNCEKLLQRRSWSLDTYAGLTAGNRLRPRWKLSLR